MTQTIDFIFDFASPNAYLANKALVPAAAKAGAHINYIPCLLGGIFKATNNQSPMQAFGGVKGKLDYQMLEIQRFIARHDVTAFRMNPHFPVNTLTLMRGAIAAEEAGVLPAYIAAGLKAMWEDGLKMDDPDVFAATLTEAGLDGAGLLAQTQDPDVKAKLIANTEAAVARGVFGIPTFFVGEDMYFGKDRVWQVVEAIGA